MSEFSVGRSTFSPGNFRIGNPLRGIDDSYSIQNAGNVGWTLGGGGLNGGCTEYLRSKGYVYDGTFLIDGQEQQSRYYAFAASDGSDNKIGCVAVPITFGDQPRYMFYQVGPDFRSRMGDVANAIRELMITNFSLLGCARDVRKQHPGWNGKIAYSGVSNAIFVQGTDLELVQYKGISVIDYINALCLKRGLSGEFRGLQANLLLIKGVSDALQKIATPADEQDFLRAIENEIQARGIPREVFGYIRRLVEHGTDLDFSDQLLQEHRRALEARSARVASGERGRPTTSASVPASATAHLSPADAKRQELKNLTSLERRRQLSEAKIPIMQLVLSATQGVEVERSPDNNYYRMLKRTIELSQLTGAADRPAGEGQDIERIVGFYHAEFGADIKILDTRLLSLGADAPSQEDTTSKLTEGTILANGNHFAFAKLVGNRLYILDSQFSYNWSEDVRQMRLPAGVTVHRALVPQQPAGGIGANGCAFCSCLNAMFHKSILESHIAAVEGIENGEVVINSAVAFGRLVPMLENMQQEMRREYDLATGKANILDYFRYFHPEVLRIITERIGGITDITSLNTTIQFFKTELETCKSKLAAFDASRGSFRGNLFDMAQQVAGVNIEDDPLRGSQTKTVSVAKSYTLTFPAENKKNRHVVAAWEFADSLSRNVEPFSSDTETELLDIARSELSKSEDKKVGEDCANIVEQKAINEGAKSGIVAVISKSEDSKNIISIKPVGSVNLSKKRVVIQFENSDISVVLRFNRRREIEINIREQGKGDRPATEEELQRIRESIEIPKQIEPASASVLVH